MQGLAAWVQHTGSGLMMSGGPQGFGPGGYFKSPLEPILPVSMELRREHRKLSVAIVVAMDRSGSMAMPAGGGRAKMDLANVAAAQVLDMLTPMDEFGVLAVDSASHVIAPLAPVQDKEAVRGRILRVRSEGGGIFIYEALQGAVAMLHKAQAANRHIILFADAADSEEPGRYKELLEGCRKAGITCSVIGLGTDHDSDAELLKDIARRGEGRIFFTDQPEDLPRIFAQDTFVVARNSFIDDPTPVRLTPHLTTLTGRGFAAGPPRVGGYNLTYLRDTAQQSATTIDEYHAPLVASWVAGTGRVLCYTGQLEGKYTGEIARWDGLGEMLTGLVRWTAGAQSALPPDMLLTQRVVDGVCRVELHLDPQRGSGGLESLPTATVLRAKPGREPVAQERAMEWSSPDTLSLDVPLSGEETAVTSVRVAGRAAVTLPPVTLAYSPEFTPDTGRRGERTLAGIARTTGGRPRVDLGEIWSELPRRPRSIELAPWLLMAGIVGLWCEVLERRTGAVSLLIGGMRWPRRRRAAKPARPVVVEKPTEEIDVLAAAATPARSAVKPAEPKPAPSAAPPVQTGMVDAMELARRRAQQRTRRSDPS